MMKRSIIVLILGFAIFILAACSPAAVLQATATQDLPTQPPATPIPTAMLTPTPLPGKVILVAPAGSESEAVQSLLAGLSNSAGLVFESQAEIQPESLGEDTRIVILLALPANLDQLAAAAPQVQFVVVSPVELPGAGNLSVIRQQPEFQAFVGGFISVLLSTDWRAGGILASDGPLAEQVNDAFVNGGRYFCGICAPGWPLGLRYPQVIQLPASGDSASYQEAALGLFDAQKVEAYYLASSAARPEVYQYLQGKDQFGKMVLLVGEQTPPEEIRAQWAATVRFDVVASLEQLWPDLLAGKGGSVVTAPLLLEDINPDNFGAGRMRLVNDLLAEIEAGGVYPFTIPAQE